MRRPLAIRRASNSASSLWLKPSSWPPRVRHVHRDQARDDPWSMTFPGRNGGGRRLPFPARNSCAAATVIEIRRSPRVVIDTATASAPVLAVSNRRQ